MTRKKVITTKQDMQYTYEKWWLHKLCRLSGRGGEFERVVKVEFHAPPSGVYGEVRLHTEDGSFFVYHGLSFRPRKKDIEVKQELSG
uniref:Uncharacterized protein n=1 Tax=viral metagenome TaxID=1070528 RepID=A0A6H1ZXT8_9ZZZZ